MSQAFLLRKELHVLEDKIQRLTKDLARLTKQKKALQGKLAHLAHSTNIPSSSQEP